ncbi:MAG: leucyl/phenylalanyl-tRNA--protein transferase [Bacteroidales bacterium]|jgi:leucyl/phenylalanyl-tRNA--protein transferase|nr:leucyl/phenylalanyl-tRNA--protein transferase [Bacteroidales bacterium]
MIIRLDDEIWFPDPHKGEDDGLFAVGGDLSVDRLLLAYSNGIFPWYAFREKEASFIYNGKTEIMWWCPMDRFVIFPEEVHISHSMRNLFNKDKYKVTVDQDFPNVIKNCSELRIQHEGAWLGPHIIEAYTKLHELGYVISVEVWNEENKLAGGFYGVLIGSCFCGESMFSLEKDTSKLALITFAKRFAEIGGKMIDCQFETSHLLSMGGKHISYDEYMKILKS